MATTRQLIARALQEIGVLALGEVPTGTEENDALAIVQRMVNSAGADKLAIYEVLRTATTLTSGTRDYTIGTGGTINIVRPVWIDRAGFILDSSATDPVEIPIATFSVDEWAAIALKTLDSSVIQGIFYDRAFSSTQRGTISTYPTVSGSNRQLVLYTPKAITGYTGLSTDYIFPPGYDDVWHYELATRLLRPFGKPFDPGLDHQRTEAWAVVKKANLRATPLKLDPALTSHGEGWSASDFNSGGL